jgi:1,4-dihydroxy-2-naphthoate polyprenyltransferase
MNKLSLSAWIHAFRLRTLPLAFASISMGIFLAYANQGMRLRVSILSLTTTLFLQILSNLANDYGDFSKGVDNDNRLGPERAVQKGLISPLQMKRGIFVFIFLSLISGIFLLYESFKVQNLSTTAVLFFILGLIAIGASIKYTIGKKAYGYFGFGDFFVFVFFGLVAVLGTYYLNTLQFNNLAIIPAIAVGFLSTGVLNLNNLRDIENDTLHGKNTLIVLLGSAKGKIYHSFLIIGAILLLILYTTLTFTSLVEYLYVLMIPLLIKDLIQIIKNDQPKDLDPYLKKLAIGTFVSVLLFGIGILIN